MSTVTSAAEPLLVAPRPPSPGRLSDELLARQAARGSDRAFTLLYQRYHQPLYRYGRSIVRNEADAQDVLQSTFTAALSALRRERRNAPVRPWLYRIAHNEAVSLLRRRGRENSQELLDGGPQTVASAEDEAAARAKWSTLVADLGQLPERQRGALLLRELSGLSHEEIAITLGTSVGGAKQAIFEARQGLAELADGRAMTCEDVRRQLSAGDRRVLRGRRVRAHLRECRGCEEFAAEIPARRAELRALAPVLPSAAAASVLSRSLGAVSAHGAGTGAAAGPAIAGAGAVGKAASTALTWKALTGLALVVTAAAGVTGLQHVLRAHRAAVPPAVRTGDHGAAAAPASAVAGGTRAVGFAGATRQGVPVAATAADPSGRGLAHGSRGHGHAFSIHGQASALSGSGSATSSHRGNAVGRSSAQGRTRSSTRGRAVGHTHSKSSAGSGHSPSSRSHSAGSTTSSATIDGRGKTERSVAQVTTAPAAKAKPSSHPVNIP